MISMVMWEHTQPKLGSPKIGMLITKIESCRYEILTYTSSTRKIGGSNPSLGTKDLVVQLVRILPCHGSGRGFESRLDRYVQKYNI